MRPLSPAVHERPGPRARDNRGASTGSVVDRTMVAAAVHRPPADPIARVASCARRPAAGTFLAPGRLHVPAVSPTLALPSFCRNVE